MGRVLDIQRQEQTPAAFARFMATVKQIFVPLVQVQPRLAASSWCFSWPGCTEGLLHASRHDAQRIISRACLQPLHAQQQSEVCCEALRHVGFASIWATAQALVGDSDIAVPCLLQTVAEMHAARWVHMNLKPSNLCMEAALDGGPMPCVTDFGSAIHVRGRLCRLDPLVLASASGSGIMSACLATSMTHRPST